MLVENLSIFLLVLLCGNAIVDGNKKEKIEKWRKKFN